MVFRRIVNIGLESLNCLIIDYAEGIAAMRAAVILTHVVAPRHKVAII